MNLNVLPKVQRELWGKLAGVDPIRRPFYLAGGTAAALHLEHRESVDLDFFSAHPMDSEKVLGLLGRVGNVAVLSQTADTLLGTLNGVKVSFFRYPYPLLNPLIDVEGLNVASLEDIAAMKAIAIGQRGSRKDFIDLYFLLQSGWNLDAVFRSVARKYKEREYNRMHLIKSLSYFADAERDPNPKMPKPVPWENVKQALTRAAQEFVLRGNG